MNKTIIYLLLMLLTTPAFGEKKPEIKVLEILNRFYVQEIEESIQLYENLLDQQCSLRFQYEEAGLELAQVGNILIIAGSEEALKPFKETKATFIVNSIEGFKSYLLEKGSTIIRDIKQVPTGKNMTIQHPDGTIIEYVQFSNQYEKNNNITGFSQR